MNGLPYYKRYARDFLEGTAGMDLDLKGPYSILIDLIYLQNGALPDDPHYIAGHLGCSVRRWNGVRSTLIGLGKITADLGIIRNKRADKETIISGSYVDKQRENGSRPKQNKSLEQATAAKKTKPKRSHTDTDTEEEREETPIGPLKSKPAPLERLPPDWVLSEAGWDYARSQGIPEHAIRDESLGFHAYWSDRGERKSGRGWEQCWATNCRRIAPRYRNVGMAFPPNAGRSGLGGSLASIAARRAIDRAQ